MELINKLFRLNCWVMHPVARVLIKYSEDLHTQQIL
jgi:hypothetical protein